MARRKRAPEPTKPAVRSVETLLSLIEHLYRDDPPEPTSEDMRVLDELHDSYSFTAGMEMLTRLDYLSHTYMYWSWRCGSCRSQAREWCRDDCVRRREL